MMMLLVHVVTLHAQQPYSASLRAVLSESCVLMEADYRIVMSQTRLEGKASIEAQGDFYIVKTEGIDIYCDGETIWTVDNDSKEVYVESVSGDGQTGLGNALMALMDSDAVDCTFSEDGTLQRMSVSLPDGISVSAGILSFTTGDKKSVTSFRPRCEFGSDWIVTDLR